MGPTKEERALIPGKDTRPADVFILNWSNGQSAALDVTVTNPFQITKVAGAATTPGYALTVAFNRKMAGAAEDCRKADIDFIPLAVESLGGFHVRAIVEIRKLGSALARHTGEDESQTIGHQFQRLSVLLVNGNSALIINRIPSFPNPEVDGII